jgi:RNase P subunit RPR2
VSIDPENRYVVTAERFPRGLRCMGCDRPMGEGETYSTRLVAMQGIIPVVDVVCPECAIFGPPEEER